MKATRTKPFFSLFSSENGGERQRLAELFTDILSEVQYIRLIVAKRPEAKVVRQVRAILATEEKRVRCLVGAKDFLAKRFRQERRNRNHE